MKPVPNMAAPVGRAAERALLSARLEEVIAGRGACVAVMGEAGMGKTWLVEALAAEGRARGARVLFGGALEGDAQPPYGPLREALASWAREEPELAARHPDAALADLLPALAPRDGGRAPILDAASSRVRLFDAVADLLYALARERPLVVVLEDLHWATSETLLMLRHCVRALRRVGCLFALTCREHGPSADADALGELLSALGREAEGQRLSLRGLDLADGAACLAEMAGQALPSEIARALVAESGGNPFHLRELFRHLVETGSLVRREGRWSSDISIRELPVPDGVRRVVLQRVARLAPTTREALTAAAVLTGSFRLSTLAATMALDEAVVLEGLEQAERAGLLRGTSAGYDFAHAIVRRALLDSLNPDRRALAHRRAGEALIVRGAPGDAAEIAHQFKASSALPGAERGVEHALAAAAQAAEAHAGERRVAFLRIARDLAGPRPSARLLVAVAVAQAEALHLEEARRSTDAALLALEAEGASAREAAAFLARAAGLMKEAGAPPVAWEPLVDRGLALSGTERDLAWARLELLRDRVEPLVAGPVYIGRWLGCEEAARALLLRDGDEEDRAAVLDPFLARDRQETEAIAAEVRAFNRPSAILKGLDVVARDYIYRHNDIRVALVRLEELRVAGERYRSLPAQAEAYVQRALCELVLGDLDGARAARESARELVARLGSHHRLHVVIEVALGALFAYLHGGDWATLAREARRVAEDAGLARTGIGLTTSSFAALATACAGSRAEALALLEALVVALERGGADMYLYGGSLTIAVTAAWELGAAGHAGRLRPIVERLAEAGINSGPLANAHDLSLARLLALEGDRAGALAAFARARPALEAAGQRPLRAIADHDEALADLRLGGRDRGRVGELLRAARQAFAALRMDPWMGRVDELEAQLGGARRAAHGLTEREVEVLRLLAAGCSSKEIASQLFVSVPTVSRHIANIYAKIGAHGRAEAAAWALRASLVPT